MFKNFLLVAVRNLFKHRTYSLVNILGLALGLTFCFLMFIYIQFEYSYDRFNSNLDRLYRVNYGVGFSGSTFEVTRIPSPFGPICTSVANPGPSFGMVSGIALPNAAFDPTWITNSTGTLTKVFTGLSSLNGAGLSIVYQAYGVLNGQIWASNCPIVNF